MCIFVEYVQQLPLWFIQTISCTGESRPFWSSVFRVRERARCSATSSYCCSWSRHINIWLKKSYAVWWV